MELIMITLKKIYFSNFQNTKIYERFCKENVRSNGLAYKMQLTKLRCKIAKRILKPLRNTKRISYVDKYYQNLATVE